MLFKRVGMDENIHSFPVFVLAIPLGVCLCGLFEGREVCAFVSWWAVEIWVHSVSSFSPHACNALYLQPDFTTRFVTDKIHSLSLYNTDFSMSSSVCQYVCTLTHSMYIRIQLMVAERLHLGITSR